jgi:hypothetical protein
MGTFFRRHAPARFPATGLMAAAVLFCSAAALTPPAGASVSTPAPTASAAPGPVRDPAQPAAEVPRTGYRSAFTGYRPWQEQGVGDWRALNDRVGRIGGWRTYLREAQQAPPLPAPVAAPAPAAAPGSAPAPALAPAPAPADGGWR